MGELTTCKQLMKSYTQYGSRNQYKDIEEWPQQLASSNYNILYLGMHITLSADVEVSGSEVSLLMQEWTTLTH